MRDDLGLARPVAARETQSVRNRWSLGNRTCVSRQAIWVTTSSSFPRPSPTTDKSLHPHDEDTSPRPCTNRRPRSGYTICGVSDQRPLMTVKNGRTDFIQPPAVRSGNESWTSQQCVSFAPPSHAFYSASGSGLCCLLRARSFEAHILSSSHYLLRFLSFKALCEYGSTL